MQNAVSSDAFVENGYVCRVAVGDETSGKLIRPVCIFSLLGACSVGDGIPKVTMARACSPVQTSTSESQYHEVLVIGSAMLADPVTSPDLETYVSCCAQK